MSTATYKKRTGVIPDVHPLLGIPHIPFLLLLSDISGLFFAWQFAHVNRLNKTIALTDPLLYGCLLVVLAVFYLADTYHPNKQIGGLRAPTRILLSGLVVIGLLANIIYFAWALLGPLHSTMLAKGVWLVGFGMFIPWAIATRLLGALWIQSHTQQSDWLVLGMDSSRRLTTHRMTGNFADRKLMPLTQGGTSGLHQGSNWQRLDQLEDWSECSWSGVLMQSILELPDHQATQLMQLRLQGIPVYRLPDFYETFCHKLPADLLHDNWFVFSAGFNLLPSGIGAKLKRLTDILSAGLLLALVSPIMLLVALAVKIESPGPVFYSQIRTGLNCKPFRVYKFRSMRQDAEKAGAPQWAKERDPRITRVGYWLRLSRLDELPQFWNVLSGEMSLIGPRPERPAFDEQLAKEIPYYNVRYLVKPGITGWAQVLYPYGASVEDAYEKLAYDLYYIKNHSLWLDIAIFFKTIRVVVLGKGR
jgi:exopolysaccharide biosynthesis polyprenyl glycosylphosphotransferase